MKSKNSHLYPQKREKASDEATREQWIEQKRRNIAKIGLNNKPMQNNTAGLSVLQNQRGNNNGAAAATATAASAHGGSIIQKVNYNSQPEPVRPSHKMLKNDNLILIDTSTANASRVLQDSQISRGQVDSVSAAALFDPTKIIKQMSQDQIVQLLKDPEISRILKQSMIQQEQESSKGGAPSDQVRCAIKEIDPFTGLEFESHGAHQVDVTDPSILGNEFEVPQEKTLNTEDFAFSVLPTSKDKPKLYVGPQEDFNQNFDDQEELDPSQSDVAFPQKQDVQFTMSTEVGQGHINYDRMVEETDSSSEPEDFDLAFQLFEGEEMSAGMANFIGIHRMQSLNSPQSQNEPKTKHKHHDQLDFQMPFQVDQEELKQIFGSGSDDEDGQGEQYMCPQTGAHFHKADLFQRILKLKKRRALIDRAIAEEDELQKLAEKKQKSNFKQSQIGQSQALIKSGWNKVSDLGHSRQIMTDGNEKRDDQQRKLDMSSGSPQNDDFNKCADVPNKLLEDASAVVLNAGRAKYASNDPQSQETGTKQSNQVNSNSFMQKPASSGQLGKQSQKNKNCVRSQERSSAAHKHSLLPTATNQPPHELLIQNAQNQNENEHQGQARRLERSTRKKGAGFCTCLGLHKMIRPSPHCDLAKAFVLNLDQNRCNSNQCSSPTLLASPSLLQSGPIKNPIFVQDVTQQTRDSRTSAAQLNQQSKAVPMSRKEHRNQKLLSNAIRHAFASNRHPQQSYLAQVEADGGGGGGVEPSVYHPNDFRRSAVAQQHSSQPHRGTLVGSSGSPGGTQARDLIKQGAYSKQQRATMVSAYSNQIDRSQTKHCKTPNQNQLTQSAQKQLPATRHKGESVSFDQRVLQSGNDCDVNLRQSIEATEALIAYRSVQDQRSGGGAHGQHAISGAAQNWTNYSSQPQQQLVGVKSSQIDTGSRYVSKISIQKAKMRQKQMVQAVLQNTHGNPVSTHKVVDQHPSKSQQQKLAKPDQLIHRRQASAALAPSAQTYEQQDHGHSRNHSSAINSGAGATGPAHQFQIAAAGATRKSVDKNQSGSGKVIVKKISAGVKNGVHGSMQAQNQAAGGGNSSQIEQVEQFYAMLSGLQVVFGRSHNTNNNVAQSIARNGGAGKEKQKAANQGTHARTNTFDNRAQVMGSQANGGGKSFIGSKHSKKRDEQIVSGQSSKQVVSSRYQNQKQTLSKTGSSSIQANVTIGLATLSERNDQSQNAQQQQKTNRTTASGLVRKVPAGRGSRPKSKSIQSRRQQSKGKSTVSTGQKGAQNSIQFGQKPHSLVSQSIQPQQKVVISQQMQRKAMRPQNALTVPSTAAAISPQTNSQKAFLPLKAQAEPRKYEEAKAHKKGYNSVPGTTAIMQGHITDQLEQHKKTLYRLETDQASHDRSHESSIQGADFLQDGGHNQSKSGNYGIISAAEQQQPISVKSAFLQKQKQQYISAGKAAQPQGQRNQQVGTASTKHRKSNSLGYKVVIGGQQQRISQPNDATSREEAMEASPASGTADPFSVDISQSAALYKTFNNRRSSNTETFQSQAGHQHQSAAHQRSPWVAPTSSQQNQLSIQSQAQQKVVFQQNNIAAVKTHRRNASLYQPGIQGPLTNEPHMGAQQIQNSNAKKHASTAGATQSSGVTKHKKSHSMTNPSQYAAPSQQQPQKASKKNPQRISTSQSGVNNIITQAASQARPNFY